jgi:D-proline reductase (dithiol) PrdB
MTGRQNHVDIGFDSFEFLDGPTKRIMKAWIEREPRRPVPWQPLRRPLGEARVALVSSAAVALRDDQPFDQQRERDDPWWGDPSFRILPRGTCTDDTAIYHLHIDRSFGEDDLDCVLPLTRLEELAEAVEIGEVAPSHYSFMGYLLRTGAFLDQTVPAIIETLRAESVDAVVLVPV